MATANAAIEGEIGWSNFEHREARSKTHYLGRLIHQAENRYTKRIFHHIRYKGLKTDWLKRISKIDSKYSKGTRHQESKNAGEWCRWTKK